MYGHVKNITKKAVMHTDNLNTCTNFVSTCGFLKSWWSLPTYRLNPISIDIFGLILEIKKYLNIKWLFHDKGYFSTRCCTYDMQQSVVDRATPSMPYHLRKYEFNIIHYYEICIAGVRYLVVVWYYVKTWQRMKLCRTVIDFYNVKITTVVLITERKPSHRMGTRWCFLQLTCLLPWKTRCW